MKILIGPNTTGLEESIPHIRNEYPEIEVVHCTDQDELETLIADADIYLGWLDRDIFLSAEELRWIQSPSSGVDGFLKIPELAEGDVVLTSAVGTHGEPLADSVFAMILAHTRGIKDALAWQQDHDWVRVRADADTRDRIVELSGSTLGIIGFGTSGRAVAKRAAAFGLEILALDLSTENKPGYVSALWSPDHLGELLARSDYVVVTVPYTRATDGMIGPEEIAQMKTGAMLVGISRGRIIDERAAVSALRDGRLAAVALDVFAQEPLPVDSELWEVDELLTTPHIAGMTQFEGKRVLDIFYENLDRFLRGEIPLRNQVDKARGF